MEIGPALVSLAPAVVGAGALAVCALAVYLSHRDRTSHRRQKIFTRQVEACGQLISAARYVAEQARNLRAGPEESPGKWAEVVEYFRKVYWENVLFLPPQVALTAHMASAEMGAVEPPLPRGCSTGQVESGLVLYLVTLVATSRRALGISSLGGQLEAMLVGGSSTPPDRPRQAPAPA